MNFLYSFICLAIAAAWAYIYVKTYQLSGYNIKKFASASLEFKLAFGDKSKIAFTKRLIRFIICFLLLDFLFFYLINTYLLNDFLKVVDCALVLLFTPVVVIITHYILLPLEIFIKYIYKKLAIKKLKSKKIIKIGITGSYGKTSTKNILAQILEKEFKVCITPANYNTEMGVTKTILSKLDDEDIFIAEMGARHKGDIKALAQMVKPDYAILTTIGEQHIETFGSLKNIEETKNELVLFMQDEGVVFFNGDSKSNLKLFDECKKEKYLTCQEGGYAYAKEIKTSPEGSEFVLVIDKEEVSVKTKLLGKFNIDNIVTASALGRYLGVSMKDIASAIKHLQPTPHRLQLIKNSFFSILDDSYNSNLVGAKEALKVLSSFKGRKIVVTPGFVEMGEEESKANFTLGAWIADVADYIVIMNETNKNFLLSGAISHNFNQERIFFASSRKQQTEVIAKLTCEGCVVLFENDLPDNYS